MKVIIKVILLFLGIVAPFYLFSDDSCQEMKTSNACQEEDYIALRAFYLGTITSSDYQWINHEGWLSREEFLANPTMPEGTDVSTWYGIRTNPDGCVVCLDMDGEDDCGLMEGLFGNNIIGSLPPELGNLVHLRYLYLSNNTFVGSLPPELGNLTNLEHLKLRLNFFDSTIPPEFGNLTNLTYLYLHTKNSFHGSLPPELGNLVNLTDLYLSANDFTGDIPPEFGNLTNLVRLHLAGNELSGTIPPELGNLINLTDLRLSSNQLSGSIPPEFGNLTNLTDLRLSYNELSGCYDDNLQALCGSGDNTYISNGNNFDAPWEDFCATGVGTCIIDDIDNTHQSTFTVYPVPAKDFVVFDVLNIAAADEIVLYDITGREISRQAFPQDKRLVVTHLNDGVYIYRIFYEDEVYSGKIVMN